MEFIVSERQGPHGLLLVITDKDLIGKIFEEENLQLDLTKKFYQGEEKNKEEIMILLEKARDIHLTGKDSVNFGLKLNLVDEDKILYVSEVPHAEIAFTN